MNKKVILWVLVGMIVTAAAGYGFGIFFRNGTSSTPVILSDSQLHNRSTSLSKVQYEEYYAVADAIEPVTERVYSAVLPHHLVAGKYLATLFNALSEQRPSVVVIIGPNHKNAGDHEVVTSVRPWQTPYGVLENKTSIVEKLRDSGVVKVDDDILNNEHSVGAILPFVKKTFGDAAIVPILLKSNTSTSTVAALARQLQLVLPRNSLVLVSVDFSHYLPPEVADFHDETAKAVLESASMERVENLEIDSKPSIAALLNYNALVQAERFTLLANTNSARIMQLPNATETTSHILGYFVKGEPVSSSVATYQFFGDIMIDRNVAKVMGHKGLVYIFEPFKKSEYRIFQGQDLLVANLEGPFAEKRVPTTKSIAFRFDPKLALELKRFGFDAFSLANNHAYDMGRANVAFTRDTLKAAGLHFFGDELSEGEMYTYINEDLPGGVAFLGIHNTYHNPDKEKMLAVLADAKLKAKTIIVNVHWGEEYQRISNEKQRELARWFIDNGVSAVIGHHPHVVQEMELYKNKPIFYSLGNFIFDQYFSKDTQEGLSVGLVVEKGEVRKIYLMPIFGVQSQVDIMTGDRRRTFWDWMSTNSRLNGNSIKDGMLAL